MLQDMSSIIGISKLLLFAFQSAMPVDIQIYTGWFCGRGGTHGRKGIPWMGNGKAQGR